MSQKVEFYRHQLGEEEAASWRRVLDTLFLTLGPQVAAFEQELGRFLVRGREGATPPHVVGTNACTTGLVLALRALDVGPGDEVITTPMTFAATSSAILHLGARPKLVDVEASTGLIDPAAVRAAIGPKTVGILPVHLYGQLADMKALRALADSHGLFVVEDSAHGVEMEREGVRPGDLGDAVVFSFYATKNITAGDGGAVATRSASVADRLRRLRNHGVTKGASDRHGGSYQHWDIVELGYKANLTDLDAALLRPQLPYVEEKRASRDAVARRYESLLRERIEALSSAPPTVAKVPWLVERVASATSSHHLFTMHAPPGAARCPALEARGRGHRHRRELPGDPPAQLLHRDPGHPPGVAARGRGDWRPHHQLADVSHALERRSGPGRGRGGGRVGRDRASVRAGRARALLCVALAAPGACGKRSSGGGQEPPPASSVITIGASLGTCDDVALCAKECDAGSADRCRRLAATYAFGQGVAQDEAAGDGALRAGLLMKDAPACVFAGQMHEYAHGVPKDDAKAARFYERACDLGGRPAATTSASCSSAAAASRRTAARRGTCTRSPAPPARRPACDRARDMHAPEAPPCLERGALP